MASPRLATAAVIAAYVASLISLASAQSTVALGPTGACPILPEATVEAQPVVYSQYIDRNTSIAPFNNGYTYIITNAPTDFVVSTTVYITNYASNSLAPTATGAPSTTAELRLGEGLPSGTVSNLPTDTPFVLGWVGLNLPTRRDSDDLEERDKPDRNVLNRRDPAQAVSNIQNAATAAQTGGAGNWISGNSAVPVKCNSATAYSLVNGQLFQGNTPVGKYQGDTIVAFGAALNGNANPIINVGFSLINGLLAWQPPDVGLAVFYSCGGVLYAVFDPTNNGLTVAPYGNCSLVAIGGLSSTSCSASLDILPVPSITIPSITVPVPSSINPTGFLSIPTPRISSIGISGILAGLSSLSIPSQLPSFSIGSLSINTGRPSLSSINLALPSITIPSTINLSPPSLSSIKIPSQPPLSSFVIPSQPPSLSSIDLAQPSLSSLVIPSQPPSLSSIDLAPPSLSSLVIPSQPPSLTSINLAPPSPTIPSSINLAPPLLSSLVVPSQPPSLSSINLAPPSLTIPSTINLAPPSITISSISIGSLSLQTPVLSPPSISISSLSIGSLSIPSFSPPSFSIPTAFPSLSIPSASFPSLSFPTPQISIPTFSTTIPINLQSSLVLNLSPPSNSPISLGAPTIPVVTIPTPLSVPAPQITLPSASIPSISFPSPGSISLPSINLPSPGSISLPSGNFPSISIPSGTLPSISLPSPGSVSIPSISVPPGSISIPSFSLPSGGSISIPSISLPSGGSISITSISLPSGGSILIPSLSLQSGGSISLPTLSVPSGSLSLPSGNLPSITAPSVSISAPTATGTATGTGGLGGISLGRINSIPLGDAVEEEMADF